MTDSNKPAATPAKKFNQARAAKKAASAVDLNNLNELLKFSVPRDLDADTLATMPVYKPGMVYISRPVPVLTYKLDEDGKPLKPFSVDHFSIKTMWVSELKDNFTDSDGVDYGKEFANVFIVKSARKALGEERAKWEAAWEYVKKHMADAKEFAYPIGIRKTRMCFSKQPFETYKICRDFAAYSEPNRLEHLIQLLNARGIKCRNYLDLTAMKVIYSDSSDGHTFMLTVETGEFIGLEPGEYQNRSIEPYTKGTITVDANIKEDYIVMSSIKVKAPLPDKLYGENILIIQSSVARANDEMRMGHQDFYCMKSYGKFPLLIRKNLSDLNDGKDLIERSMPAEVSALVSLGLPFEYIIKPEGFEDSLLLQARPKVANMFLFAMRNIEYTDGSLKEGWYAPDTLPEAFYSGLVDRSPRMAIGGAFQEVEWERDAEGKIIPSPMPGTILLILDGEPKTDKATGKQIGFNTEKSRINFQKTADKGADVDGDRIAISTPEGARLRYEAGLIISTNVEVIKAKNPYPNTDWSERGRENMSLSSNPRLIAVGMGDIPTQDARSLYLAGQLAESQWNKMARAGAYKVQEGVSAPKYFFKSNITFPIQPKRLIEMMKELEIGRGAKRKGQLWQPSIDYIDKRLKEIFPAETKLVTVGSPGKEWRGGYTMFLDALALHDKELGDVWITHVRRCFSHAMRRQGINNIMDKTQNEDVAKYIAKFIKDFPDKPHIWTWLLKPEYLGLTRDDKGKVLKRLGLPFNATVYAKNKHVEIEGM